jgi:putative ABC transport system permease protein
MENDLKVSAFLVFKNLVRGNKVFLLLSISILILIYINLMFIPNLIDGLVDGIYTKLQDVKTSQINLTPQAGEKIISDSELLIEDVLNKNDSIKAGTKLWSLPVQLEFNNKITSYGTTVVEEDTFREVYNIEQYLIEGDLFDSNSKGIVLGSQVAGGGNEDFELFRDSLSDVHVGDSITMNYLGKEQQFTVTGIFYSKFAEGDTQSFITTSGYEMFFASQPIPPLGEPNSLAFSSDASKEDLNTVVDYINNTYKVKAISWENIGGIVEDTADSFNIIADIVKFISIIIGAITIFIVTYVDLTNKKRQVGIQRAIGITNSSIFISYTLRAFIINIIAIVMGSLIYIYAVVPLEHMYPLEFPFGEAYLSIDFNYMINMSLVLLAVSLISSAIPTGQTIRLKILDAISS